MGWGFGGGYRVARTDWTTGPGDWIPSTVSISWIFRWCGEECAGYIRGGVDRWHSSIVLTRHVGGWESEQWHFSSILYILPCKAVVSPRAFHKGTNLDQMYSGSTYIPRLAASTLCGDFIQTTVTWPIGLWKLESPQVRICSNGTNRLVTNLIYLKPYMTGIPAGLRIVAVDVSNLIYRTRTLEWLWYGIFYIFVPLSREFQAEYFLNEWSNLPLHLLNFHSTLLIMI